MSDSQFVAVAKFLVKFAWLTSLKDRTNDERMNPTPKYLWNIRRELTT